MGCCGPGGVRLQRPDGARSHAGCGDGGSRRAGSTALPAGRHFAWNRSFASLIQNDSPDTAEASSGVAKASPPINVSWAAGCAKGENVPVISGMCDRLDPENRAHCWSVCDRAAAGAGDAGEAVDVSWAAGCAMKENEPIVFVMCDLLDLENRLRCRTLCDDAAGRRDGGPQPRAWSAPPPPSPRPRVPDSYDIALSQCVRRVRESGGTAPAVCWFERPLDLMDFGQRHCNMRCASMSGMVQDGGAP
jgi:hypothetical protein